MNWMIVLAVALSVAVGSCAPTKPAIVGTGTYQVIDLGVHPGFESSEPTGINSVGQVSGFSSRNTEPSRRAFFYDTPRYGTNPPILEAPSTTRPWSWAPSCALTIGYEPFRFIRACSGI